MYRWYTRLSLDVDNMTLTSHSYSPARGMAIETLLA